MKKTRINLWVDFLSLLLFWLLTLTGLILQWKLPAGSGRLAGAHGPVALLWGMDRQAWGSLHGRLSLLLTLVLVLHIWLHWQWIVGALKKRAAPASGQRWILGALSLLALLVATVAPLAAPIETINPLLARSPGQGQQIYETSCLRCHGSDGRGILPIPSDVGKAKKQLRQATPAQAHSFLRTLTEAQLEDLITYLQAKQ